MQPEGSLLCSQRLATGPYVLKINPNVILLSTLPSSKWCLTLRTCEQNPVQIFHALYATHICSIPLTVCCNHLTNIRLD